MKKLFLVTLVFVSAAFVFAQVIAENTAEPEVPVIETPKSILNNKYYLESVRLNDMAEKAYDSGDYDRAASLADQAAEQARLSDEFVTMRLTDYYIARAHSRYTWAGSIGAAKKYPSEYKAATTAYDEAVAERKVENWDKASEAAFRVMAALVNVKGPGGQAGPGGGEPPRPGTLPAQYVVRQWMSTGDCFWTIAGWSWVYGDSHQWRTLYEANKDKIPKTDNPNWIEPGMILDIPSLKGEVRSGMWDPLGKY
jgi:nucleoid-associated protein YgaU